MRAIRNKVNCYDYGARMYDPALGRWHVMDPAIEDAHHDYSPYAYVYNNPVIFIDPYGLDSINVNANGQINIVTTDDESDSFYYTDKDGNSHTIGTYEKNEEGLIQLPSSLSYSSDSISFGMTVKSGNEDRSYIKPEGMAALIGALAETGTTDLVVIGFSNSDGSSPSPSTSHKNGKNGDIRFLKTDKSGNGGYVFDIDMDFERQVTLNRSLSKFGWKDLVSSPYSPGTSIQDGKIGHPVSSGSPIQLPGTRELPHSYDGKHFNHIHMQGFRPNVVRVSK